MNASRPTGHPRCWWIRAWNLWGFCFDAVPLIDQGYRVLEILEPTSGTRRLPRAVGGMLSLSRNTIVGATWEVRRRQASMYDAPSRQVRRKKKRYALSIVVLISGLSRDGMRVRDRRKERMLGEMNGIKLISKLTWVWRKDMMLGYDYEAETSWIWREIDKFNKRTNERTAKTAHASTQARVQAKRAYNRVRYGEADLVSTRRVKERQCCAHGVLRRPYDRRKDPVFCTTHAV